MSRPRWYLVLLYVACALIVASAALRVAEAMAGSNGTGTGGLNGSPGVSSVGGIGGNIGPGCVTTATGIKCDTIDAGVLNVQGQIGVAGQIKGSCATCGTIDLTAGFASMTTSNGAGVTCTTGGVCTWSNSTDVKLGATAGRFFTGPGTSDISTAPTVTACSGGTAATITYSNGTASFVFDVGTQCAGESTAVITLPAATNGWLCSCSSTTADRMLLQRVVPAANTTTVTMQNIVISTGANGDFTDSADVGCICRGG